MITIVAKCILKEGKKQEFIELNKELVRCSQNEKGCIAYDLYQDLNNENMVSYIENWEDEKAIELHNDSQHFLKWVPILNELKTEPTIVNLYKII